MKSSKLLSDTGLGQLSTLMLSGHWDLQGVLVAMVKQQLLFSSSLLNFWASTVESVSVVMPTISHSVCSASLGRSEVEKAKDDGAAIVLKHVIISKSK